MSKLTAAYVAGSIDGEGCLDIQKRIRTDDKNKIHHRPRLRISLTEKELIEWLQKSFGGNISTRIGIDNYKDSYTWSLMGGRLLPSFLQKIYPYLKIKRKQAEVIIKCLKTLNPESYTTNSSGYFPKLKEEVARDREEFYFQSRQLNQRGKFMQPERLNKATPLGDVIV